MKCDFVANMKLKIIHLFHIFIAINYCAVLIELEVALWKCWPAEFEDRSLGLKSKSYLAG